MPTSEEILDLIIEDNFDEAHDLIASIPEGEFLADNADLAAIVHALSDARKTESLSLLFDRIKVAELSPASQFAMLSGPANNRSVEALQIMMAKGFDPNFRVSKKDAFTIAAEQSMDKPDRPPVRDLAAASREGYEREKGVIFAIIGSGKLKGLANPDLARFAIFAIDTLGPDGRPYISMKELATVLTEESDVIDIPKSFKRVFGNRDRMESILAIYGVDEEAKSKVKAALQASYGTFPEMAIVRDAAHDATAGGAGSRRRSAARQDNTAEEYDPEVTVGGAPWATASGRPTASRPATMGDVSLDMKVSGAEELKRGGGGAASRYEVATGRSKDPARLHIGAGAAAELMSGGSSDTPFGAKTTRADVGDIELPTMGSADNATSRASAPPPIAITEEEMAKSPTAGAATNTPTPHGGRRSSNTPLIKPSTPARRNGGAGLARTPTTSPQGAPGGAPTRNNIQKFCSFITGRGWR